MSDYRLETNAQMLLMLIPYSNGLLTLTNANNLLHSPLYSPPIFHWAQAVPSRYRNTVEAPVNYCSAHMAAFDLSLLPGCMDGDIGIHTHQKAILKVVLLSYSVSVYFQTVYWGPVITRCLVVEFRKTSKAVARRFYRYISF